jgi:hypothetical protein
MEHYPFEVGSLDSHLTDYHQIDTMISEVHFVAMVLFRSSNCFINQSID